MVPADALHAVVGGYACFAGVATDLAFLARLTRHLARSVRGAIVVRGAGQTVIVSTDTLLAVAGRRTHFACVATEGIRTHQAVVGSTDTLLAVVARYACFTSVAAHRPLLATLARDLARSVRGAIVVPDAGQAGIVATDALHAVVGRRTPLTSIATDSIRARQSVIVSPDALFAVVDS